MKKFRIRIEEFKKEMLKVKGGEFIPWHEGLSPIESFLYKISFKELQIKNETHR